MIEGLQFVRPWALAGVPVALVLLLASLRSDRAVEVVLGTLGWLEGDGISKQVARGSRRRIPAHVWLVAAALALVSVAWSGPRWGRGAAPRVWTIVVDPSSAMALPAPDSSRTRLEVGVERAARFVAELARPDDRVRWIAPDGAEHVTEPGASPAHEDLRPFPWGALAFGDWNRPGVLLVTDLEPADVASDPRSGWVAVGAEPVPGSIGVEDGRELVWDGAERVEPGPLRDPRRVLWDPALDPELARAIRVWASERGFRLEERSEPEPADAALVLSLETTGGTAFASGLLEHAGWRARVRGNPLEVLRGYERLWPESADDSWFLVRPGRIRVGIAELDAPQGEARVRFALSLAELFDEVTLAPAGTIGIEERRRTGPASERAPSPPLTQASERDHDRDLPAWLAALAAVLGLGAVSVYRSSASSVSNSTAP